MALLTVQVLAALSLKLASRDPRLIRAIADSLLYMGEGEAMELVDYARDKNSYIDLAFRKTGSLFGSATEVGSLVGGGDDKETESLLGFGNHIGIAFQIRDDILDCISNENDLGKPVKKRSIYGETVNRGHRCSEFRDINRRDDEMQQWAAHASCCGFARLCRRNSAGRAWTCHGSY